jgi:hypothetical protein
VVSESRNANSAPPSLRHHAATHTASRESNVVEVNARGGAPSQRSDSRRRRRPHSSRFLFLRVRSLSRFGFFVFPVFNFMFRPMTNGHQSSRNRRNSHENSEKIKKKCKVLWRKQKPKAPTNRAITPRRRERRDHHRTCRLPRPPPEARASAHVSQHSARHVGQSASARQQARAHTRAPRDTRRSPRARRRARARARAVRGRY